MNISKSFKKGEVIFHEGDPSDCAYVIGMGSIEVYATTPEGHKVLGILGENEIFGEMGLIDGISRSASARANEASVVSIVTPKTFEQLAHKNPKALLPILKILTLRLRKTMSHRKRGYKLSGVDKPSTKSP
jgi:CRP-like cAMP-binding protein